ncbi:MAG: bifunctional 2-polyprenyl-6-hydroxyphenol methylase/3-demethylubiquinol 3-O-methyltransferase UbiG [Candidatus Accumulibacter sp.]|jgi:2-polyprenyl-6-hydroxyphenyl methylase/3-demethylubiquinone-9 3-methyltransferase|nr:bifunctional 2-polyprenyl-6-hydroxyphenol methylase/3-demethylubiquinol 3-O-methyltransferase UbiG [Accumulibacter sp.]
MSANTDPVELDKFSRAAHRWWDPESEFKPLHRINPLRVEWIERHIETAGKNFLDLGCGGGILSESLARRGAKVLGIDLSEKALGVARLHSLDAALDIDYRAISVEDLAAETPGAFDAVACMEMLEHVPDPESVVSACAKLLKPGGHVFFSTINRSLTAYLSVIVGAENLLRILPPGTHEFARFIRPSELARSTRKFRLETDDLTGFAYNPVTQTCRMCKSVDVNYLLHARLLP